MLVKTKFPNQASLRINPESVKHLSSLKQFWEIPDEALIKLAKRRTGLHIADRWVAIALILGNRIPIPVAAQGRPRWQPRENTAPAKLQLIPGGRFVG